MNTLNNILDFIVPILNLVLGMILVLMALYMAYRRPKQIAGDTFKREGQW